MIDEIGAFNSNFRVIICIIKEDKFNLVTDPGGP
jgi:hypothetical protein